MNVREATDDKVKNNEEIMNMLKIMGMIQNKTTSVSDLR
jgi:DNA gyrase/topoisomerase IV subunit B